MQTFQKVRFHSKEYGSTAGLVLPATQVQASSLSAISRLYPYTEAMKMKQLQVSPEYATWQEAFLHEFV